MKAPGFWQQDGALALLLSPLSLGFVLGGSLRRRLSRPRKVPVPVLCVGNLVAGGAGKTPVALAVGDRLAARGTRFHYLSRGYGGRRRGPLRVDPARHGAADVGDEPLLLARRAPTWIARDRAAGAEAAAHAGAELIVMDDGLQNPSLHKDLSLIVIDGSYGFGNGRVIPAGPLRERPEPALARADAVVLLGPDRAAVARRLPAGRPVLRATVEPVDAAALAGARVLAFAGIARPEKFFATLERMGCRLVGRRGFPDHHPYSDREVDEILATATAADAVAVTTEKDHVRLPAAAAGRIRTLPITVRWDDPAMLDALLQRLL